MFIQLCPTLCDPMDSSLPGPLSMEFSRQEYWSGLPFLFSDGTRFSLIAGRFFIVWASRQALFILMYCLFEMPIQILPPFAFLIIFPLIEF